jgi:hypothetical protein
MSEKILDLPYVAIIPYNVQIDDTIPDACKIYYGQIVALTKKCGYMWATDKQLAEMKNTSEKNIQRWHGLLEASGHIKRVTKNQHVQNSDGTWHWQKKRKIYVNEGFSLPKTENVSNDTEPSKTEDPEPLKTEDPEPLKNEGSYEPLKNEGSYEPLKNEGIINNSLDVISKQQRPTSNVVVVSLEKLDISEAMRIKLSNEYSADQIDLAVTRCLRWKTRPSDEVGISTTLRRADTWSDNPTIEERSCLNSEFLKSLNNLDETYIGLTRIIVGNKYIEFVCGSKVTVFNIEDEDFKMNVNKYIDYLKQYI